MRTNLLNDLSNVLKKGTSLSEKGTSLNLLPKMDREWIENDSRMDRQSLGKIWRSEAMSANHALITQLSRTNHPISLRAIRYAAVLFMLFMVGIGNAWGTNQTYTIDKPSANVNASGPIQIFGEKASKSVGGSSINTYSLQNTSVYVMSYAENIKSITLEVCWNGSASGTKKAVKVYGLRGKTFSTSASNVSATLGGSAADMSDVVINATNSTTQTLVVTCSTPISCVYFAAGKDGYAVVKSVSVVYDDAISYPSLYSEGHFTSTTTGSATNSCSWSTVNLNGTTAVLSDKSYYKKNSANTFALATGETLAAGDVIVLDITGAASGDKRAPEAKNISMTLTNGPTWAFKTVANTAYDLIYVIPTGSSLIGASSFSFDADNTNTRMYGARVYHTAAASTWYVKGGWNSWGTTNNLTGSGTTLSATVNITTAGLYEFKIHDTSAGESGWYGNAGNVGCNVTNWPFATDKGNCKFFASETGNYTFTFNTSTKALSVTYPTAQNKFYYKNTGNWSNVAVYRFKGGINNGWPGAVFTETETVCGDTYYYTYADPGTTLIFTNNISSGGDKKQTGDMSAAAENAGKYVAGTGSGWTAFPTYTVTYNKNGDGAGGSGSVTGSVPSDASSPYACGSTVTVLGKGDLALEGYTFEGWNTAPGGGGTSYAADATFDISANTTLYAQWELIPTYDVIYNTNGGTGGSTATQEDNDDGSQVTTSANGFTKTGYKFKWWNTAANGSGEDFYPGEKVTIASADVNLYAQWEQVSDGWEFWCGSPNAFTTSQAVVGDMVLTKGGDNVAINTDLTADPTIVSKYNSSVDKHAICIAVPNNDQYIQVSFSDGSPINTLKLWATTNKTDSKSLAIIYSTTADFSTGEYEAKTVSVPASNAASKALTDFSPATADKYFYARIYRKVETAVYGFTGGSGNTARIYGVKAEKGVNCSTPAAPTNFTAGSISATGATFTITDAADAASYDIYYSTESTAPTSGTDATTTSTSKTKEVTGLTAATTYYAWVRSVCNASNKSAWVALNPGGDTHTFATSCVAPSTVTVAPTNANGYRYTPGETISLTCTASGGSGGDYSYQWQKYYDGDWHDIANATSAVYSKSNCTTSDGGSYRCIVSTGEGCETISDGGDGYKIRVWTFNGNYNDEGFIANNITWTGANTGTVTLTLNANSTYKFKVYDNDGKHFGCNSGITADVSNWTFRTNENNCSLTTGKVAGEYTFTIDITNVGSNNISVSVVYPKMRIYMSGGSTTWCNDNPVFFAHTYGGVNNDVMMTAHACEAGLFYADVPSYNTKVTFTRQKTGSTEIAWWGNANFLNKSKDEIVIGSNNKFTCTGWDNNEGVFSGSSYSPSTYTITFASNGSDGGSAMSNVTAIPCDENRTLAANTWTKTGHTFAGWVADVDVKVGGSTKTAGTVLADGVTIQNIRQNITLTAQWTANQYSVSHSLSNVTATSGATGANAATYGTNYTAEFAAAGGFALPSTITVTIGGAATTHYTWNSSTGAVVVDGAYITGNIVITVTGVAAAPATLYTVTFNSNGGSAVSPITQASEDASITKPSDPTRASYEFDGWYATAGEKISWPYTPEADITLYARWEEECDAEGVAKSTADVPATGYTTYQEVGGSNVAFTSAPSLGFKYKDADGNTINSSTKSVVRNNAYSCKIQSSSSNKGSIKTNNAFSNVDSISFYFAASDKDGCKIAVWCSTDNFSADSTQLLSATTYAGSNSEFKLKTLAIPSGKKASALRFKFRFTVTGSGKTCYMDSLKVYSSTSGGGTCYHVYYHGNGAESGYVNDTVSYTAGSKATVLNYNYGRYPLAKTGYDFRGWATSASGAVAYSAGQKIDITSADVDLYAVWVAESDALVTWTMNTNTETWGASATSTTDGTNITSIGTTRTGGGTGSYTGATAKVTMATAEVTGSAAPSNSANFTFTIGATKQVEISKFDCQVFNVSDGNRTYKAQISDAAGNVYNSTNTVAVSTEATLTDASFVFGSGKILRGAVTIRIYAWKTSDSPTEFRMGPDVKFYGTVQDYACATPSAPTISGVSEYVPGQTITLTASHDGENYDNLTTYTWYKGADWATASGTTPVQAADTGEGGYTLTIDDCTTGNAGLYWCEAANGTCKAHNSEGYNIIVYPTYTITYNLNGGTNPVDPAPKTSYTQMDEDYTLPVPTKADAIFAGWYGASDFSGLPTVVLGAGSVGNKEYWAKWGETVTVSWTVTKVDDELYRGGGGYSVKAVINETDWSTGFMDELELTATEGVTLKNIEVSENGESKVQVTADFDITTELAADATSITFTLNVPADEKYGPKVDEHEEDLDDCGGSGSDAIISIFKGTSDGDNTNTADAVKYKQNSKWTDAITGFASTAKGVKDALYVFGDNSWSSSNVKVSGTTYVRGIQNGGSDASKYHFKIEIPTGSTATIYLVAGRAGGSANFGLNKSAIAPQSGTHADKVWYASYGSSKVLQGWTIEDVPSGTYYLVGNAGDCIYAELKVTLTSEDGGITPTLTWETDLSGGVSKRTSDDDFIHTASQNKNSLGAITYSSNNTAVATVNSTTGQVHLVGAAGTATITATIAASGCFSSANVSYTITVTDDCDDEAGTIETEDLGCSGVKMTITGHTTTASTSYQWYKVGTPSDTPVGTNQDNFTATEAGSYYVIVTNTGDRHCAKRSTNTITVEAQAAATVTKIVDSWYVKKDRRTPDIELVKTTNATGFTVTNGSSVVIWNSDSTVRTGFAGCGFHMGENGIIYLNGTKDNGDAPAHDDGTWAAGDETLTITAIGCGGNASQNITIHKQAATDYKEIAFVADGGKGMRKDSITVGHGDGTELYEYLDSVGTAAGKRLFQLSERNIYWTTDEKAIREEYSRFDAILITDDPSTNTVVKTGDDYKTKGYVNAFGTMVDVRPIFTMEAYVSALKNWGSKGIAGNPQSPNPRQYEMRLECKDHEIYGAGLPDPDDGTNVWEEVIDGETFRHVILVDSTKGVYKGVAYNAETAGNQKPALQGFTGEAAGSLLGLGRILEGTLQAAIERQEEPAARLLVMGINAKALQPTCALTNEGKTVIKNILVYLLKTNMEEVDDCSNYFTGKTSTDWNTEANWSKGSLPNYETKVRILAPCVVSGVTAHVAQVDIVSSGESSIRYAQVSDATCNGKLTINADGALIVGGEVRAADAPHFAANDLKPTTVNDLIINTNEYNQAALIFNNDEGKTQATVNLYSLGRKVSETNQFQYFAIPMSYLSVNPTFANETHGITIYTYVWLEATGWERRGYYTDLYAFEGIGITTDQTDAHAYTMKGTLASTKDQEIPITADGKKLNLIGNSWTAPIQISELEASDFGDASSAVEQTVYIYCAGHGKETADGKTEAAGQWLAIPFEATRFDAWDGLKVIPSMQAFQIKTTGAGTLTLDYDKHVRGGSTDLTAKLRAPQRRAAHDGVELMRIRVADSKTHTDLYLFEGDQFSDAFDNGWEANYRVGTNESAKLYARVATGVMSVAAMSDLEGTPIYFIPGQETEYTFTFGGNGMGYYLNDLKLQQSTLISEGAEYSFTYEKGDAAARFMISATPYESPQVTTGTENVQTEDKPRKILYNNKLYIIYNGHVYSADGAIVK